MSYLAPESQLTLIYDLLMKKWNLLLLAFLAIFAGACTDDEKKTADPVALEKPVLTLGEVGETSIAFTWNAVDHASGYEYRLSANGAVVAEKTTEAGITSATVEGLQGATDYEIRLRALGEGDYLTSEYAVANFTTTAPAPTHVVFADAVLERLVKAVEPAIDGDGDGRISFAEAEAVTELDFGFEDETSVVEADVVTSLSGIESFTSLKRLGFKYHRIADASPVEELKELEYLNLGENPIARLDLTNLGKLTDLRLYGTDITELDLEKSPLLVELYLQRSSVTTLDLSPLRALENAYLSKGKLETLKAVGMENLTRLDAVENRLTQLEVSDCPKLGQLHLNGNLLEGITGLKNMPGLYLLNLYGNKLQSLDVTGLPLLMQFFVYDNALPNLDLSQNLRLMKIFVSNNPLRTLDLSANEMVESIEAENMSQLEELNLKNGGYFDKWNAEYSIVVGNAALRKVITDPGDEFTFVQELFSDRPEVSVVTE